MFKLSSVFALFFALLLTHNAVLAQTEVQAWGNITGIRVEGQIFRLESSLRLVENDWRKERITARERNWTTYRRENGAQIVRTCMDSLFFTETVRDISPGKVQVKLEADPHSDIEFVGTFFHITLPARDFAQADIRLIEPTAFHLDEQRALPTGDNETMRVWAKGLDIRTAWKEISIQSDSAAFIIVKVDNKTGDVGLYFTLQTAQAKVGQKVERLFDITVSGSTEVAAVKLQLFPDYPGNVFLGLGGNFRIQNIKADPPVIDYCLENLDVRMGRVELPWQWWHPVDTVNPLEAARRGELNPHVKTALEMAQRLYKKKMPVLLSAWSPPVWAAEGDISGDPLHADGTYGNPLRSDRTAAIYASLADYIVYLKEAYGVEIALFSFNESDLGINVRHTAEEHAAFIKGFGAYLKSRGLTTKLLLGDTADANGFEFVNAALEDPETWPHIGAVSFHSWRGWEKETLLKWYTAADRLNVPLIVGEGSIDAGAWRYPNIFEETHYALDEIKLYVRMLAICQPQAILQWQLTADYSPLSGGGIFGNDRIPLQPTQRFWNLKQLSHTPAGLYNLPFTSTSDDLFVAALGDAKQKKYTFHLVNEGPGREVVLTGLPVHLKRLRVYVTDQTKGMEKGELILVHAGEVKFKIGAACFVSLMSE